MHNNKQDDIILLLENPKTGEFEETPKKDDGKPLTGLDMLKQHEKRYKEKQKSEEKPSYWDRLKKTFRGNPEQKEDKDNIENHTQKNNTGESHDNITYLFELYSNIQDRNGFFDYLDNQIKLNPGIRIFLKGLERITTEEDLRKEINKRTLNPETEHYRNFIQESLRVVEQYSTGY